MSIIIKKKSAPSRFIQDLPVGSKNRQQAERADRIKKAVQMAGGKKVVSDRTGIPMSTLGYYFTPHEVRLSVLERLAEACRVTPGFLAFGEADADRGEPAVNERYATVPRFNVQASAGSGALVNNEQIVEHLAFDRNWLKSKLNRVPSQVVLIEARGDSMEPTIRDGDLLLVDVSAQEIASSAIHVIELEGELLVKRLERRFDGSVLVHSDNTRYKPQELSRIDRDQLRIIGQVIWQGGPPRS